jgi:hypothetical protein
MSPAPDNLTNTLNWSVIADALIEANYSPKVGQSSPIRSGMIDS